MQRSLNKWITYKGTTKKWCKKTQKSAKLWATNFAKFFRTTYGITAVNQLSFKVMEDYRINHLPNLSPDARYRVYEYLKLFFRWCIANNELLASPIHHWERIKRPKPNIQFFSLKEIKTILNAIDMTTPHGIQNRTILEILYATGIRHEELISLNTDVINFSKKTLFILRGKNDKDRIVPLLPSTIYWINKHLTISRPKLLRNNPSKALFILRRSSKRITPSYLDRLMKEIRQITGISHTTVHAFRRSCATHLMNEGVPLIYIKELLGHENMQTTQRYLLLSSSELKTHYEKSHPRDRFDL